MSHRIPQGIEGITGYRASSAVTPPKIAFFGNISAFFGNIYAIFGVSVPTYGLCSVMLAHDPFLGQLGSFRCRGLGMSHRTP